MLLHILKWNSTWVRKGSWKGKAHQTRITLTNIETNIYIYCLQYDRSEVPHSASCYLQTHWTKSFKDKPVQVGLASTSCPSAPAWCSFSAPLIFSRLFKNQVATVKTIFSINWWQGQETCNTNYRVTWWWLTGRCQLPTIRSTKRLFQPH